MKEKKKNRMAVAVSARLRDVHFATLLPKTSVAVFQTEINQEVARRDATRRPVL